MENLFKKYWKKENFMAGFSYGLGGALIIVLIVFAVVFAGNNNKEQKPGGDKPELRFTVIAPRDCPGCFDLNVWLNDLTQGNEEFGQEAIVDEISREIIYVDEKLGKQLIKKYNIEKVPVLLASGELDKDPNLSMFFETTGEVIDDVFVQRQMVPPYFDLATGEVKGNVSIIYLSDQSCETCFDPYDFRGLLSRMYLPVNADILYDVSSEEGKELIERYGITSVPTVLLKGDLMEYPQVDQYWPMMGIIAGDGTYVFTASDQMGNYKDLETGEEVEFVPSAPVQ